MLNLIRLWLWIPGRARLARLPGTTAEFLQGNSSPRHDLPGLRKLMSPEKDEGAGNAGRRCTRALVCKKGRRTHTSWSQVQPNTSGIPRAMLDDLFRALLGVPGVLVTVASRVVRET